MHAGLGKLLFIRSYFYSTDYNGIFSICKSMQFFCFLLIVLVAEIATGVYAYLNQDQLMKIIGSNVKHSIQNEYGSTELPTTVFDTFQQQVIKWALCDENCINIV